MDPNSVLKKTPKGIEEIATRKHKLPPRLRSLLIVVSGKATAGEIAKQFESLGDVSALLDELAAQGFVEGGQRPAGTGAVPAVAAVPAGKPGFDRARADIARMLVDGLGPNADMLTDRIEKCASPEELRTHLEGQRTNISAMLGKQKSDRFWQRVAELLG